LVTDYRYAAIRCAALEEQYLPSHIPKQEITILRTPDPNLKNQYFRLTSSQNKNTQTYRQDLTGFKNLSGLIMFPFESFAFLDGISFKKGSRVLSK